MAREAVDIVRPDREEGNRNGGGDGRDELNVYHRYAGELVLRICPVVHRLHGKVKRGGDVWPERLQEEAHVGVECELVHEPGHAGCVRGLRRWCGGDVVERLQAQRDDVGRAEGRDGPGRRGVDQGKWLGGREDCWFLCYDVLEP